VGFEGFEGFEEFQDLPAASRVSGGFRWFQVSCHAERSRSGFEKFQEFQLVSVGFKEFQLFNCSIVQMF
jgi:hypothetical protein